MADLTTSPPTIVDEATRRAGALDDLALGAALAALLDRIGDWDEASDVWSCDCGGAGELGHDPGCPYQMYFDLSALLLEAARRLRGDR